MRRVLLYIATLSVIIQAFSIQPVFADNTTRQGQRNDNNEYYYLDYSESDDKLTLIGTAGEYAEDVKFKEVKDDSDEAVRSEAQPWRDRGYRVFTPEGKSIKLADTSQSQTIEGDGVSEKEASQQYQECTSLPTKRWIKREHLREDPPEDKDRKPSLLAIVDPRKGTLQMSITGDAIDPHDLSRIIEDGDQQPWNVAEDITNLHIDFDGDGSLIKNSGLFLWGKLNQTKFRIDDQSEPVGDKPPETTGGHTVSQADREAYNFRVKVYANGPDRIIIPPQLYATGPYALGADLGDIEINTPDRYRMPDKLVRATLGEEDSTTCKYKFYDHFWRWVSPYSALNPQPGLPNGKLLGNPKMKFDDWANNGDNRLAFFAYHNTSQTKYLKQCANQQDMEKCTTSLDDTFYKCYGRGIDKDLDALKSKVNDQTSSDAIPRDYGSTRITGGPQGSKDANVHDNVDFLNTNENDVISARNEIWKNKVDEDKAVECYTQEASIKDYFADDEEITDFAESIFSETTLPPSLKPDKADAVTTSFAKAPDDTRCSLGMLGWILCPTISFIAAINDKVYDMLKNWLVIAPFQLNGSYNTPAYETWKNMRTVSNAIFVVAFMYILYAQITGNGSSAYGLRVRAPRIIIAALLTNLSYILCGIIIDITNVLGDSLFRVLMNVTIGSSTVGQYGSFEAVAASVTLAGGAAAGTWVIIANLAALIPMLVAALIALAGAFVMLLFRQAIIILLIAISPLAFAMIAVPGLEKWFDKWKSIFLQLAMVYPIFALLFGGGNMIAEIIRGDAAEEGDIIMTILSLGIQVLPLFLIPFILKMGSSYLQQVAGVFDRGTKSGTDGIRKKAQDFRDDRKMQQQTRALNGRRGVPGYGALIRFGQRSQAVQSARQKGAKRDAAKYAAKNRDSLARGILGKNADAELYQLVQMGFLTAQDAEAMEEHEAALANIHQGDPRIDKAYNEILSKSLGERKATGEHSAAIERIVQSRDMDKIHDLIDNLDKLNAFERKVLVETIHAMGLSKEAAHLDSANLTGVYDGTYHGGVDGLYASAAANNLYTPETVAQQSAHSLSGLETAHNNGAVTDSQYKAVGDSFHTATSTPQIRSKMSSSTYSKGHSMFPRGGASS